ncbi:MAG: hypothetical protein H6591_12810 [Flavobacteriales bacterium]|nr:hypothetical protein [Flavobacteriales bacterium]
MSRRRFACALFLSPALAMAQLEIPAPLQLNGSDDSERQITGVAVAEEPQAGMSAAAVRGTEAVRTAVSGTALLTGSLVPPIGSYSPGMSVIIIPEQSNAPGAVIDLNGLGPVPIVKSGGLPLDSADLIVGSPQRLVYDGQRFHVIGSTYLPCPSGFHIAAREYCIEDSSRAAADFPSAGAACQSSGGRLCSFAEWLHACLSDAAFIGTVLDYEWVDHAANNAANAKRVGKGSDGSSADELGIDCKHGHHVLWSTPSRFRCCYTR